MVILMLMVLCSYVLDLANQAMKLRPLRVMSFHGKSVGLPRHLKALAHDVMQMVLFR